MSDDKGQLESLENIEKKETTKTLQSKAMICIGEYPIKTLLKENGIYSQIFPMFIEKSTSDIKKWLPNDLANSFMLGFEDSTKKTHFWYDVLPLISKDESLIEDLKKNSVKSSILFASIWDGVGGASLPALIPKFRNADIDSFSVAIWPSKIQPPDAHFNAYAALRLSCLIDCATVILVDRDNLENYEGVDRKGVIIKGNSILNYILGNLVNKDLLVEEISELSRSFNVKLFTPLAVTGASLKLYGSIENMLNAALLKPLFNFDLSSATLLYVLIRMPSHLSDKLTRTKIELEVTNWFKEKTNLQSIHVSEPIYTSDQNDRIDAVLFIGGFSTEQMFRDVELKIEPLEQKAIERSIINDKWEVIDRKTPVCEPEQNQTLPNESMKTTSVSIVEPAIEAKESVKNKRSRKVSTRKKSTEKTNEKE